MEHLDEIRTLCERAGCACIPGAPMKEYTSVRIGGPAALLLKPKSVEEIGWILSLIHI